MTDKSKEKRALGERLARTIFATYDRPHCIWGDGEDIQANKEYMNNLQPDFYIFLVSSYSNQEAHSEEFYGMAVRQVFHQALETFFSLYFALIQSPSNVAAWVNCAKTTDLINCVKAYQEGRPIPYTQLNLWDHKWSSFAKYFCRPVPDEDREGIEQLITKTLSKLTNDFLNQNIRDEYNSIKHGLRSSIGPVEFELQRQDEKTGQYEHLLTNKAALGARIFSLRPVKDKNGNKIKDNYSFVLNDIGWDIPHIICEIEFLVMLIGNLKELAISILQNAKEKFNIKLPETNHFGDSSITPDRAHRFGIHINYQINTAPSKSEMIKLLSARYSKS